MESRSYRKTIVIFSLFIAIVAYFFSNRISPTLLSLLPLSASLSAVSARFFNNSPKTMAKKAPVYFMSMAV